MWKVFSWHKPRLVAVVAQEAVVVVPALVLARVLGLVAVPVGLVQVQVQVVQVAPEQRALVLLEPGQVPELQPEHSVL